MVHSYQYHGGIDLWHSTTYSLHSRSPLVLNDMTSNVVVVSDTVIQATAGSWAPGTSKFWTSLPAHGGNEDNSPLGGNHAFGDGSAAWITWDKMMLIHTWANSRQPFWYQADLGEVASKGYITPTY